MIQRLLRGRMLYVTFGVLAALLYVRMLTVKPFHPPVHEEAPATSATTDWWRQEFDASTLTRLAEQQPRTALLLSVLTTLMAAMALAGVAILVWAAWTGRLRHWWRLVPRRLADAAAWNTLPAHQPIGPHPVLFPRQQTR